MSRTHGLVKCALCVALITVCSWISIPFPVPFTLQTFAVFFAAALLGPRISALAIGAYLLLGAAGVPVFSGFRGGVDALVGPTGGYLAGFLPAVVLTGLLMKRLRPFPAMLAGLIACYALGSVWYMAAFAGETDLMPTLSVCVFPFIIPDILKLILANHISNRLKNIGR